MATGARALSQGGGKIQWMAPETRQLIENQLVTLKETSTGGTVHERLKQISRIFIRHGVTVSDDGSYPTDLTDSRAVAHLVLEHCLSEAAQAAFEGLHSDFMDMTWEALVRNMKEQLQSSFPSSGFFAQLATLPPRYALQGGECDPVVGLPRAVLCAGS